ncbi:MAG: hypothetical protein JJE05_07305 [Actinobacteria bacterium]|nr:hypothetical protein [Actinomycetota bacterium]
MNTSPPLGMKSLSFCSAVALLVGVLVPLMAGPARANHGTSTLEVTPETVDAEVGTTHVLTATVSAAAVTPIEIDFEVESGPVITKVSSTPNGLNDVPGTGNDGNTPMSPDLGCVVAAAQTTCTVSFTSAVVGTNLVRGWIDHDGLDAVDPTTAGPAGDGMAADEPRGEALTEDPAWFLVEEPNTTDAVDVTWTAAVADEFVLNCQPETKSNPVGTAHIITCTATKAADSTPAAGKAIDVEMSGANDTDAAASNTSPDLTCTTAANGTCTVTHPAAASTAPGETTYRAWVDADGSNATVEANVNEPRDETTPTWVLTGDEPNGTDVVAKTWTGAAARTIDCLPATGDGDVGSTFEVTCTVKDATGDELGGVDVVFEETGEGDFATPADAAGTTDQTGKAKTHLVSDTEGEQVVTATIAEDTGAGEPAEVDECDRAAGDPTGAPAGQCQDSVTITWTDASIDPRCDDPGVICGTDGDDVLVGTAGDDLIICGDGNDTVKAMGGDDIVECGNGNDEIEGGGGSDHLKGQGGNDTIAGGGGNDSASGGSGKDRLLGGKGKDKLRGGSGNDNLKGGAGDDLINGGPGKDTCVGGKGKDKVSNCEK